MAADGSQHWRPSRTLRRYQSPRQHCPHHESTFAIAPALSRVNQRGGPDMHEDSGATSLTAIPLLRPRYGRCAEHQEQRKHRTAMSHVSPSFTATRSVAHVGLHCSKQRDAVTNVIPVARMVRGQSIDRGADPIERRPRDENCRMPSRAVRTAGFIACFGGRDIARAQVNDQASSPSSLSIQVLRICADPRNLPFSNDRARVSRTRSANCRRELQKKLDYMFFPQATGFVRMTLGAHRCDVSWIPQGDDVAQSHQSLLPHGLYLVSSRAAGSRR